jgi:hypothetical protein
MSETEHLINEYFHKSGALNCCIFTIIMHEETPDHMFQSVKNLGRLLPLRGNTFMLLFPLSIDHELLLHHLDKRFHLNIIEQFSTDTPRKVLACMQKYN